MQITIDIPEEKYQWIKEHKGVTDFKTTEMLYNAVRNGTDLLDYVMQSIESTKKAMNDYHYANISEDYFKGSLSAWECMKMKLM